MDGDVSGGIHRIDTALGDRLSSLYLFVGRDRALLFDAGVAGTIQQSVLPYLREIGLDPARVSHVVISHCDVDHAGGAADAAECFPGTELAAHECDADAIGDFARYEADRGRGFVADYGLDEDDDVIRWARDVTRESPVGLRFDGDQDIDLGDRTIRILHTPGHSRGQLSVYDADRSLIAISDAVLGDAVPLASGAPAFPPTYRFVDDYLATIAAVRALGVDTLATAHYGVFRGAEILEFLDESERFVEHLRKSVLEAVAAEPSGTSLSELLRNLNPSVGRWPADGTMKALAFPVAGHVEQLAAEGYLRLVPSPAGARIELA